MKSEIRSQTETALPVLRPTHIQWFMLSLATAIMMAASLQRASMGIAGKVIQDEFLFSTEKMGWILSAFSLGYAFFQIPWGYAGDRYGPRGVLAVSVLWCSLCTAAIGLAPRFQLGGWFSAAWVFMALRFLVGVGVAAVPSNCNKTVGLWMAPGKRGIGVSAPLVGSALGNTIAPILIAWTMQRWGWRWSFYLCGVIGLGVALSWLFFASNRPEEHPRVNAAELELIRGSKGDSVAAARRENASRRSPPWDKIIRSRSVWAVSLSNGCQGYAAYVFYNWFFIYLIRVRGLTLTQGGLGGAMPFISMALLSPAGGWVSDRLVRKFGKRRGRQLTVWLGMGCSAVLLWAGGHSANNLLAIPLLAGAAGFNFFGATQTWAACIDLAPNYSGSVSALSLTCANLGGWLSAIVTAFIATRFGWTQSLDFTALITILAGVLWIIADPSENIEGNQGG